MRGDASLPSREQLEAALEAAGSAHHDFEQNALAGVYDEQWPGWYAAYVLGRVGDFVTPTQLAEWLEEVTARDEWAARAADHIVRRLDRSSMDSESV